MMTDKEIAENLGQQVYDNFNKEGTLLCPVCNEWDDGTIQPLSSFGDNRGVLFCPHCDMSVTLVIERYER